MPATTPRGAGARLVVEPFTAARYAPDRVRDLAAVTSPPYDVVDDRAVARLQESEPHNVVRLIRPRDEDCGAEGRYEHAAGTLRTWLAEGVLVRDERPSLYVYEQAGAEGVQRGLLAAVGVHDPDELLVLPHEDVMPGPVADRFELMRATGANLEPVLLVHAGAPGPARDVVEDCARREPLLEAVTEDGVRHRLWSVDDPGVQRAVADDLADRTLLIADGHHRYATYRRLRDEAGQLRGAPGPWGLGLALLVDTSAHPLAVRAIHRSVAGLPPGLAAERARGPFSARRLPVGARVDAVLAELERAGAQGTALALGDGDEWWLLEQPDDEALGAAFRLPERAHWRHIDAGVLHEVLLERVWQLPEESVGYHHDAASAVTRARETSGSAVLLNPVTVEDVLTVAAEGRTMPRKSTSFGPKPRTGLVVRLVEEPAVG